MRKKRIRLKVKNILILFFILILMVILIRMIFLPKFEVALESNVFYLGGINNETFQAFYKGEDVTDKVKVTHTIEKNKIGKYEVKFEYNTGKKLEKAVIEIEIKDSTNPVITLKSSETLMHVINTKFVDPGYTANDNYDGDISSKVKVSGDVDISKEGEYTLKYTVEDSSGNKAINKRKVIVTTKSPATMSVKEFSLNGFFDETMLKENDTMPDNYVEETIFVGDSTALYYVMNGVITGKQLWHKEGVSLETIFTQNIYINHVDSKMKLIEAIENKKPKRILLSLGTNSVATMEIDYFISKYETLLKEIKAKSPNTIVIVQSIFPVASILDSNKKALNNDKINKMNYYLLELCSKLEIPFLNTAEVLKDENGTLKEGYYRSSKNEIGVHLSKEGNIVAMDYFKSHVYKN